MFRAGAETLPYGLFRAGAETRPYGLFRAGAETRPYELIRACIIDCLVFWEKIFAAITFPEV